MDEDKDPERMTNVVVGWSAARLVLQTQAFLFSHSESPAQPPQHLFYQ